MPLESFTYITSLNSSNPGASDGILQGDDHIRGIKSVLLATFPQLDGATTVTDTRLTELQAGSLTGSLTVATNITATSGRISGNGSVPAGAVCDFAMATPPTGWLECDGAAVSRVTYADLFTAIGTTWGSGDGSTTFNVPDAYTSGRYRRSRTATVAVGVSQADTIKAHNHTATATTTLSLSAATTGTFSGTTSTDSANHTHTFSGTTSGRSADHTHTGFTTISGSTNTADYSGGTIKNFYDASTTGTTGGESNDHTHTYSGTTSGVSAWHTHTYSGSITATTSMTGSTASTSVTVANNGAETETRPLTMVVLTCIKT